MKEQSSTSYQYDSSGSSRLRRFMPALHPEYFKVDARSLSDYLVFMERYAAYVNAHRTDKGTGDKDLSWQSFFASDVSVFLAKLKSLDREAMLPFFLHGDISDGRQLAILQKKLHTIFDFVKIVNQSYWHVLDLQLVAPKVFRLLKHVEHIKLHGYLGEIWHAALSLGLHVPQKALSQRDLEQIWGLSPRTSLGKNQKEGMERLSRAMNSFLTHASEMVHYGSNLLEESLQDIQHHNPGMALLIAFLNLYQYLQEDLNALTSRHLDYFYKTLLQQDYKPSEPDYAHVYFKLSDHVKEYIIAKGTLFKAGVDKEGYDYLYEATDFLTVTKAKITDLATIYLSKTPEQGGDSSYERVSGIYHSPIVHSPEGNFDFSVLGSSMATFGEDQFRLGNQTLQAAEIGFAVSSPLLLLSEGERLLNIVLTYQLKSLSVLFSFLERQAKHTKSGFERVFDKVFSSGFKIYLSSKEGWYEVESYSVLPPNPGSGAITFVCLLSKGAPAIVPIGEDWPHPEDQTTYNTGWPILKICLSPEKSMYSYTYLKDLKITDCLLTVDVKSVKNLEVYNDLGKLDTSTPFYPFGSMPVVGSSLLIGHEELYKKNIETFSLDLYWHNLPRTYGGFKEYYKDYEESIDHESFKVETTALSDYEFHPKEKAQRFPLFGLQSAQGQVSTLSAQTLLEGFDVKSLKINGDYAGIALPPYDNKAKLGYLRLELVGPEMAFGHHKYPNLYATKILKGLKSNKIEALNPPYTPQLKSICLNYKASARLNFEMSGMSSSTAKATESAFLIQPYGIRTVFEHGGSLSKYFLPNFEHDGYLLMGVEGSCKGQDLTLYFVLDPQVGNDFEVETPSVEWFYIAGDKWVPFAKKDIVFDTTQGFTTSGIVKIAMPNIIDAESSMVPNGKFWLAAALKGNVNLAARIKSLYTQALLLQWVAHRPDAAWKEGVVANSITSLLFPKPEIAGIVQPSPSFGGRPQELEEDFYVRISERLQHRNRCVTRWDYERMVLDRFPAVSQVKCLSSISHPEYVTAGSVMVVVVPKTGEGGAICPKFNYSELQEIRTYLKAHAAVSVNIQVINPVYEEVKVSASIVCGDENQQGIAIEQLHRDLHDFICPWYRDSGKEVLLGGNVYVDDIEAFIANRTYVSFVTKVSLLGLHYSNGDYQLSDTVEQRLGKVLHASRPWVVLVPMRSHQLSLIAREAFIAPDKAAIENLRLGTEFVLAEQAKPSTKPANIEMDTTGAFGYVSIKIDL